MRKAKMALARKLTVVLHRTLADGTRFVADKTAARGVWKKTKRIRAATDSNCLKRGPVAGTMDQVRPQPCFGTARSSCAWMTLRFSDCIRQVRVAVTPIEKLADLGACDAIFSHLLHGLAAEIRIASVRMLRHHVEPLY